MTNDFARIVSEMREMQKINNRGSTDLRAREVKEKQVDEWLKANYKPVDKQGKIF